MSKSSDNWFYRKTHKGEIKGKLGLQVTPGVYEFYDNGGRMWMTTEEGSVISVINTETAAAAIDVIARKNQDGAYEVVGLQTSKVVAALGVNAASVNVPPINGSTQGPTPMPIETRQLIDGMVYQDASENPLVLTILPFWYETAAGDQARYGGGTIDVTPYLPTGAGTHGWVKVGFDKTGVAPVAEAGTPIAMSVPLTVDDLALIALNGYVPLAGVILSYGQSSAPVEKDFLDCSNIKDSGSGGSFYQTVEVNDVTQTQRGALDLKAGTNVTLTPTDNSGSNRTEVLIDASAAGVSAPQGYVAGFEVDNDGTNLTLTPGTCRNSDHTYTMVKTTTITINPATNGANGLDSGSLANSTWYYAYVIAKSSDGTTAGLLSTSATAPTMPSGYDKKRRVGACRTNGSATILQQRTGCGDGNHRRVFWEEDTRTDLIVVNGVDFSGGWADVNCSAVVPTTGRGVMLTFLVAQPTSAANLRWEWREKGVTQQSWSFLYAYGSINETVSTMAYELNLDSSQKGQINQDLGTGNALYAWPFGYHDDLTPTITGSSGA